MFLQTYLRLEAFAAFDDGAFECFRVRSNGFRRRSAHHGLEHAIAFIQVLVELVQCHEGRFAVAAGDVIEVVLAKMDRQRVLLPKGRRASFESAAERRLLRVRSVMVVQVMFDSKCPIASLEAALVLERLIMIPEVASPLDTILKNFPADLTYKLRSVVNAPHVLFVEVLRLERG